MISLFLAGGPFMFATLTLSVVTLGIFIWRAIMLWGGSRWSTALVVEVRDHLAASRPAKALQACDAAKGPHARVLKAALMRADRSEKEIRRAVEAAALEEIPKVRSGTVYLPQLSNLATLFGLIGTIHGLIIAFSGAGAESAATRQIILSRGIAIAFYNTFFGLIVATMGIVFYLVLLSKMNSTLAVMEHAAATVVDDILTQRAPTEQVRHEGRA